MVTNLLSGTAMLKSLIWPSVVSFYPCLPMCTHSETVLGGQMWKSTKAVCASRRRRRERRRVLREKT